MVGWTLEVRWTTGAPVCRSGHADSSLTDLHETIGSTQVRFGGASLRSPGGGTHVFGGDELGAQGRSQVQTRSSTPLLVRSCMIVPEHVAARTVQEQRSTLLSTSRRFGRTR
jgi:hypothetical protein